MNKLLAVAAATLVLSAPALALTTYSDRTAFNAVGAGTAFSTDFENLGDSSRVPFSVGPIDFSGNPYSSPGIYYSTAEAATLTPNMAGSVDGSAFIQVRLSNYHDGPVSFVTGPLTLSSTAGFQMIGFDMRPLFDEWGSGNPGEKVLYWTDTGESGTFALPSTNTVSFLGLSFDTTVHSISFRLPATRMGHTWFGIDNLQTFGAVSAVPEPSGLALLLGGLGAVGFAARRRQAV